MDNLRSRTRLDDDLSRGPVTTLDFEKKLIRTLAVYKINLYSPYFEHTAAYASNPLIAPPGGCITASDAAALVAYAATAAAAHFLPPVSTYRRDIFTIAAASAAWAAAAVLTLLATGSKLPAQILRRR